MVRETIATDISEMPDVARLAREVARTGKPHALTENGSTIAVISPVSPRRKGRKVSSREELQQVLAATHGAWKGLIDPDEFKRQRRQLQRDDRPPRSQ